MYRRVDSDDEKKRAVLTDPTLIALPTQAVEDQAASGCGVKASRSSVFTGGAGLRRTIAKTSRPAYPQPHLARPTSKQKPKEKSGSLILCAS